MLRIPRIRVAQQQSQPALGATFNFGTGLLVGGALLVGANWLWKNRGKVHNEKEVQVLSKRDWLKLGNKFTPTDELNQDELAQLLAKGAKRVKRAGVRWEIPGTSKTGPWKLLKTDSAAYKAAKQLQHELDGVSAKRVASEGRAIKGPLMRPADGSTAYVDVAEYLALCKARDSIIRANKSLRMRNLPTTPTPAKPAEPLKAVMYNKEGDFEGVVYSEDEFAWAVEQGFVVKWEPYFSRR